MRMVHGYGRSGVLRLLGPLETGSFVACFCVDTGSHPCA